MADLKGGGGPQTSPKLVTHTHTHTHTYVRTYVYIALEDSGGLLILNISVSFSGVSRVWQVGQVPWAPLEGGANQQV